MKFRIVRSEKERLEVEDFIKAMFVGALIIGPLSFLALFVPLIGFNAFLLLVLVPYYAGYHAGKRTDHGHIAGFILGVAWTAVEIILLFIIGNRLALAGRVHISTLPEVLILAVVFTGNTFSCWLGGGVGSKKRFLHRLVDGSDDQTESEEEAETHEEMKLEGTETHGEKADVRGEDYGEYRDAGGGKGVA